MPKLPLIHFDVLTLFPEVFKPFLSASILGRAVREKIIQVNLVNIRDFALGRYRSVDEKPYGGGAGMIMRVDVLVKALESVPSPRSKSTKAANPHVVLLDTAGRLFSQKIAQKLAEKKNLILICGHYEGVDDRIRHFVSEVISIGDYILTGGEIPAMVLIDSITRLIPGVIGERSLQFESFQPQRSALLEYPQYTRPAVFRRLRVPVVLLSGNHEQIEKWRQKKAEERTEKLRKNLA